MNLVDKIKGNSPNIRLPAKLLKENNTGFLFDTVRNNPGRGLGDIILSTAVLPTLKRLYGKIYYVVREYAKPILHHNPYIEEIYTEEPKDKEFIKRFYLEQKLENYYEKHNQQERIDALAELLQLSSYSTHPQIFLTAEEVAYGKIFRKNKINIAVSVESTGRPRGWKKGYLENLMSQMKDFEFHIFGIQRIQFEGNNFQNYTAQTSVRQLISIVSQMDFIVSGDSVLSHLAGAFDIPAVVLYSEIPKGWRCGYYQTVLGLQANCECSPCWARQKRELHDTIQECIKEEGKTGETKCLLSFTPEIIKSEIEKQCAKYGLVKAKLFRSKDGLGDIIQSLPLAEKLSSIDYQIQDKYIELFEHIEYIPNVYPYREKTHHEEVINPSGKLWGWKGDKQVGYKGSRIDAYFQFCNMKPEGKKPEIPVILPDWGKKWLHKKKKNIVIAPVSDKQTRTYPKENLIRLIEKLKYHHVILVHDKRLDLKVNINLSGQTSINELISMIYNADFVITVDTAVMHIAGCLEKPFLLLASTFDPEWLLKYYATGKAISANLDCQPCSEWYQKGCIEIRNIKGKLENPYVPCLKKLKAKKIVNKMEDMMGIRKQHWWT